MRKKIKKYSKNSNLTRVILITIIIICIGILLGVTTYCIYKLNISPKSNIILIQNVNTSVNIVQYGGGLNGDKDALKFGKVPIEGSATRYLNINTTEDALVQIEIGGKIAQFLSVDKNNFILPKNTPEVITFQLDVPADTTIGNYTGNIKITFFKQEK